MTDSKSVHVVSTTTGATMFKYNGKIWNPKNPEKKLKQLGITWNDVEIIKELPKVEKEIEHESWHNPKLYYFYNPKDKTTITSIYPTLDHLKEIVNINEYSIVENLEGNRN